MATRLEPQPFKRRLRRLRAAMGATDRPIIWLRGGPGTGKSRLLKALQRPPLAANVVGWRLLDAPTADVVRTALATLEKGGRRAPRRVVIASRDAAVAQVLLAHCVYGTVAVLDDAALFVGAEDCHSTAEYAVLSATGGWPMLVDGYMAGRESDMRRLLPAFLQSEALPQWPPKLSAALFAALDAPLTRAALEFLSPRGECRHPLLVTEGAATRLGSSWVASALDELRRTPRAVPPAIIDDMTALFAAHADPVPAILSLLRLGRADHAIDLFKRSGGMFFGYRHGYRALERVLSAVDSEREQGTDELLFARLWLMIKSGQPREALLRLDARYPRLPVDLRRMRLSHRPYAVLLRIDISLDLDETPPLEVITSWGRLQTLLPPDDLLAQGLLFNTMAIRFLQANALTEAQALAEEALAAYQRAESPYLAHFMLLHLCDIAFRQSRSANAASSLREAEAALQRSGLAFNSEPAIIAAFHSRIAYEEGRFADCSAEAEPILEALLRGDSWPDLIVTMAEHFVLTAFWRLGLREALQRLDRFALTLSRRHGHTAHRGLQRVRIRLMQVARRHAEAGMLIEEYELQQRADGDAPADVDEQLIKLRWLMSQDDAASKASRLAAMLSARPELEIRQRIGLAILQAQGRHRSGDEAMARRHLRAALREAELHNLKGVLAEYGEFLERLLPPFIAEPGPGNAALAVFAQAALRVLTTLPAAAGHSKAVVGMTRQEHRVLAYVIDGYTNKRIARALNLSHSTVKFHLRGVFRKLGVSTRAAVGEALRRRGLVT